MDAGLALAVRVILAIGLAWALTFILGRRALRLDLRGAGVVGGVCAGVALGPMALGRVAPGFHERIAVGGVVLRESIDAHESAWSLEREALLATGVSDVAVLEAERRAEFSKRLLEHRLERERALFQDVPMGVASSLGLVALMLGAMRVRGVSLDSVRLGLVVTLLSALVWAVLARKQLGVDIATAAATGGVLAAGSVWSRGRWRAGFGLACAGVAVALLAGEGTIGAAWRAGTALALGVVVGRVVRLGAVAERRWAWVAHGLLVPAVAALMVSSCDLSLAPPGALAFVLVAGVLGADIHFASAFVTLGWMGRGWRRARPMTAWHGAYAQGWGGTQIVLASLVLAFHLIEDQPEVAGALGLAAAAMAVTGELTRSATHKSLILMRRVRDPS